MRLKCPLDNGGFPPASPHLRRVSQDVSGVPLAPRHRALTAMLSIETLRLSTFTVGGPGFQGTEGAPDQRDVPVRSGKKRGCILREADT